MKYHASRSITIDANLDKVRPHVADFHKWNAWSPWTIIEPEHESKIENEAGKVGHSMSWSGEIIGSGQLTIENVENNAINYNLEFIKPFKSHAKSGFILEDAGDDKTRITWTMDSSLPFFCFFMIPSIKAWIEMDYDRGLKMLKEIIEKGKVNATTTNEGVIDYKGFSYVGIEKTSTMDEMPKDMSAAFEKLMSDLEKAGATAEKWVSVYTKMNMKDKSFTYIAAASDEGLQGKEMPEGYVKGEIPSQKMLKIQHKGSYKFLGNAWSMGMMYLQAKKIKKGGNPFEFYVNNPKETKEEDLITDIYYPVK